MQNIMLILNNLLVDTKRDTKLYGRRNIMNRQLKMKKICNYSAPSTTNEGNFPRNSNSKAEEEETLCLRQVDK